ncbi:hypothetical protein [Paenibacillus sp. YN15]|uniref:hypothetical protein n=1 Tax=Paenibacillus sp. YN15 TaxID=1742774 RepID=UPI000DCBA9DF|nr:hypothetical protein [Paenibacillus sp. YN15]RAU95530.1 hypothetical protein DQG13_21925 [Paenibacillus sp. YN15]
MAASFALLIIALVIPGCDHGAKAPSAVNLQEVRYFDVNLFPAEQQEMVAVINQHEKALNERDESGLVAAYAYADPAYLEKQRKSYYDFRTKEWVTYILSLDKIEWHKSDDGQQMEARVYKKVKLTTR